MKARELKRAKTVAKYAEKRKSPKEAGDYQAIQKLPKNASPIRLHNRESYRSTKRLHASIWHFKGNIQRNGK